MSGLVIKGVSLLGERSADLVVTGGLITDVVSTGSTDVGGVEVIDADGLVALPGLVDLHTHLREPGREDAETIRTRSAASAVSVTGLVLAMASTAV